MGGGGVVVQKLTLSEEAKNHTESLFVFEIVNPEEMF